MVNIPKGTRDICPDEIYKWHFLENKLRQAARCYNIKEIRTPIFEHTELFLRSIGGTSDIVNKEMYTFQDKGGRSLTLKPEGTAGVVRAFIENGLFNNAQPTKTYYFSPIFRYEQPQSGRYRQHTQFGIEIYGTHGADSDAEVISFAYNFFTSLGIKDLSLKINSIGCGECRQVYRQKLIEYFKSQSDKLCKTCTDRLEKNPLRVLDCKEQQCKQLAANAPKTIDYVCDSCAEHFNDLKRHLDNIGVGYIQDSTLVRGLDYYTRNVFEFVCGSLGAQSAVCGGGRYDNLVEELGGKPCGAVGFGIGLDRLILLMETQQLSFGQQDRLQVYFAPLDDGYDLCYKICNELRKDGFLCDIDHINRSLKAQLKYAAANQARLCVIVGGAEIAKGVAVVKDMDNQTQSEMPIDSVKQKLVDILKKT